MILNTCICIMKRCRPNGSARGIYEHVRGKKKHNISLNLIKRKHTYLFSNLLKDTQNYSNLLNSEVLKDKILNSVIRFSTQWNRVQLKIRYSTHWSAVQLKILNSKVLNSTYSTRKTWLMILEDKAIVNDAIYMESCKSADSNSMYLKIQ